MCRLAQTLGHAEMQSPNASTALALAAAESPRCRRPSQAKTTQHAAHQGPGRSGCMQVKNRPRPQPPASPPRFQRSATRGGSVSTRATAGRFVVRASRGSAAPGSQRVVVRGARGFGGSGASRGARTIEQPTHKPGSYSALMASGTIFKSSVVRRARPNPVFNRTPCGSPHLAFISFWAKRGLPQGVRLTAGLGLARCTTDDLDFLPLAMSAL